jgi:hypothetical protein
MQGTLKLEIETGNAAMSEADHLADALRFVARCIDRGDVEGAIHDENGNRVGTFWMEDE